MMRVDAREAYMKASKRFCRRAQVLRAEAMVDTYYTPSEFAEGIGLPKAVLYKRLLPAGLPAVTKDSGHYWIPGARAAVWLRAHYEAQKKVLPAVQLGPDETYCIACHRGVKLEETRRVVKPKGATRIFGQCPLCGNTVSRVIKGK
jgi:hypothetical protein